MSVSAVVSLPTMISEHENPIPLLNDIEVQHVYLHTPKERKEEWVSYLYYAQSPLVVRIKNVSVVGISNDLMTVAISDALTRDILDNMEEHIMKTTYKHRKTWFHCKDISESFFKGIMFPLYRKENNKIVIDISLQSNKGACPVESDILAKQHMDVVLDMHQLFFSKTHMMLDVVIKKYSLLFSTDQDDMDSCSNVSSEDERMYCETKEDIIEDKKKRLIQLKEEETFLFKHWQKKKKEMVSIQRLISELEQM